VILILPVIRIDRDPEIDRQVRERMPELLRRRRRRLPPAEGLLSPATEERVHAAFERLRAGDVSMANLPEYDPGPAIGIGPLEIGTWPWPGDTGDETGA
jgi:hypothetical protein